MPKIAARGAGPAIRRHVEGAQRLTRKPSIRHHPAGAAAARCATTTTRIR